MRLGRRAAMTEAAGAPAPMPVPPADDDYAEDLADAENAEVDVNDEEE